jgi:hypothetical protein
MHYVFYISSHGHGHAVRESFLINMIPDDINVTIVSTVEESFFQDEITRPYNLRQISYDAGVVQFDALQIDMVATLASIETQIEFNRENLLHEVAWIQANDVTLLISDSNPWVGKLASQAEVASTLISNFTWVDILEPYQNERHAFNSIISEMRDDLKEFTSVIELSPTMESVHNAGGNHITEQMLYREGFSRPQELREILGLSLGVKIALLYVGVYGLDEAAWQELEEYDNWHFISLYDIPVSASNFTKIDKTLWTMQDFSASVDVVIAKLGYNTVVEALTAATPMLYIPRPSFSESFALEEYLSQHGSCFELSEEEFRSMKWQHKLETLVTCKELAHQAGSMTDIIAELNSIAEKGVK